jgi:hypothetical protein
MASGRPAGLVPQAVRDGSEVALQTLDKVSQFSAQYTQNLEGFADSLDKRVNAMSNRAPIGTPPPDGLRLPVGFCSGHKGHRVSCPWHTRTLHQGPPLLVRLEAHVVLLCMQRSTG